MSQPTIVNKAVVELVGLGKQLSFKVIGSDSQELPPGSSFNSPAYLWSAAFAGSHKAVKCDIQQDRIYFVGKFKKVKRGNSYSEYWGPAR